MQPLPARRHSMPQSLSMSTQAGRASGTSGLPDLSQLRGLDDPRFKDVLLQAAQNIVAQQALLKAQQPSERGGTPTLLPSANTSCPGPYAIRRSVPSTASDDELPAHFSADVADPANVSKTALFARLGVPPPPGPPRHPALSAGLHPNVMAPSPERQGPFGGARCLRTPAPEATSPRGSVAHVIRQQQAFLEKQQRELRQQQEQLQELLQQVVRAEAAGALQQQQPPPPPPDMDVVDVARRLAHEAHSRGSPHQPRMRPEDGMVLRMHLPPAAGSESHHPVDYSKPFSGFRPHQLDVWSEM
ncbi:hypothetical protein DIPPA_13493 [Diplonema papillatum]|nr:hypothetical protein DIPPA_13493 [Diplonema papillatum]